MADVIDDAYPVAVERNGGAYTVLKKLRVDPTKQATWIEVHHGLNRVPNWVRVTKCSFDFAPASPTFPLGDCCPGILEFGAEGTDLQWDPGLDAPQYPSGIIDLTQSLYFGVINADEAHAAYFLVEIGVTHSTPK